MMESEWFMAGFLAGLTFGLTIVSRRVRSLLNLKKSKQKEDGKGGEG